MVTEDQMPLLIWKGKATNQEESFDKWVWEKYDGGSQSRGGDNYKNGHAKEKNGALKMQRETGSGISSAFFPFLNVRVSETAVLKKNTITRCNLISVYCLNFKGGLGSLNFKGVLGCLHFKGVFGCLIFKGVLGCLNIKQSLFIIWSFL